MGYLLLKTIISAIIIVVISEVAKRSSVLGALFASLPLISLMAMVWLYVETRNAEVVAILAKDIFWLVLPSLALFITFPLFVHLRWSFSVALFASIVVTICCYGVMIFVMRMI